MASMVTRTRLVLGAAALLALLVVPVALAGTEGSPQARASGVKQKLKKVTQQVTQLQGQVNQLQGQLAALQGEQGGGRPPLGPAGGDLAGSYPNPEIGANAVGSAEVALESLTTDDVQDDSLTGDDVQADSLRSNDVQDESLTGTDIAADAIGQSEIAQGAVGDAEIAPGAVSAGDIQSAAVGSDQLGFLNPVEESASIPPGGGVGNVLAFCPAGSRIISGGAYFAFPSGDVSASRLAFGSDGWFAEGQNNGTVAQSLTVQAICLDPRP